MENRIKTPSSKESRTIKLLILIGVLSILYFLFFFFQPKFRNDTLLFFLLSISVLYSLLKKLYLWYNYLNISVPEKPEILPELKVDVLTTYFPGEPYEMITRTLLAIKNIRYPHTSYLCDEADDAYLKSFCEQHGIRHVTRDNRIHAKAGNINNTLYNHATGDICVILDPDHIPEPEFLHRVLPYFSNPKIGFVQIVQAYYNIRESLVAQAAAEQTYQFYGPMMMSLNAYGSVNAIGANCVFRRAALDSIGGHAPGLCEDMHTTMLLYSKAWEAVYVPEVLEKGLAPSNITSFFKQQLKWARGTFDLFVKVYPKVFEKLTPRQRIHFGILPLHYFAGVIYLINFIIPIWSLMFSTTPWAGNIIEFALVVLPVIASSVLIRTYIQKWVIEKEERGFHLLGGLLHINTWWIYLLGLCYTITNKHIPYLPTPKEDEGKTNLRIMIPNMIIGLLSLVAIIYGLNRDLTPFSIIMAGFALFNISIMLFGIYFSVRITNQKKLLETLRNSALAGLLKKARRSYKTGGDFLFQTTRRIALPLLLMTLVLSMSFKYNNEISNWAQVRSFPIEKKAGQYLGVFFPDKDSGLSEPERINALEATGGLDFNLISFYLGWKENSIETFPHHLMAAAYEKEAVPLITWEPWGSGWESSQENQELRSEKNVLRYIVEGHFDGYIREFARLLKTYDRPVFLRFAHEFDNPQYPWSAKGGNSPEDLREAWRHVVDLFRAEDALKVMFVWNPWKSEEMHHYYPGDDYVDWVGFTILDYGPLNSDGKRYSFAQLYRPFHEKLFWFTRKPVMLAEFGALKLENEQAPWIRNALKSLQGEFSEISAVVLFNSAYDRNIPKNDFYQGDYLDWTLESPQDISELFGGREKLQPITLDTTLQSREQRISLPALKGVRFKKGVNWRENYATLTREELTRDFRLMKKAGINSIYVSGGNIYDHNLISISEEFGIQLIYEFQLPHEVDFIRDTTRLAKLREEILTRVAEFRNKEHILGYSFRDQIDDFFHKPLLFPQRTAFYTWLGGVMTEIRQRDKETALILDLPLNFETGSRIKKAERVLPGVTYGLRARDTTHLREVMEISLERKLPVFISAASPEYLLKGSLNGSFPLVLENWQDQRLNNFLRLDGLLNFEGEEKLLFKKIGNYWNQKALPEPAPQVKILKPAIPLLPDMEVTYHAVMETGDQWKHSRKGPYRFRWHLIKMDLFGNLLAIKEVGRGSSLRLKIPEYYQDYQLLLTAEHKKDDYVRTSRSRLHTPLKH